MSAVAEKISQDGFLNEKKVAGTEVKLASVLKPVVDACERAAEKEVDKESAVKACVVELLREASRSALALRDVYAPVGIQEIDRVKAEVLGRPEFKRVVNGYGAPLSQVFAPLFEACTVAAKKKEKPSAGALLSCVGEVSAILAQYVEDTVQV